MKKLTILVILTVLFAFGCQEESSILDPTNNIASGDLSKGRPILNSDLALEDQLDNPTYNVKYSQNFTVSGSKGARLSIRHRWDDIDGSKVWLEAELFIPRGAFNGTKTFDMIFDVENLSMELYPSPFSFNKPVEFSMGFYGVDLSNYLGYDFDFNYLDGEEENIKYFSKYINFETGEIEIWDAQLHHFSRYGWTRTKTNR